MAYYPLATEHGGIYRLVAPDGANAVFNDPSDLNYVGALTEVTGLDSPEVRESAQELVEADGGVHGNFYFGRRPITLSGRVFGHSSIAERAIRMDRARRASNALRGDSYLYWKPSQRAENLVTNPRFRTAAGAGSMFGWGTSTSLSGATNIVSATAAMPDDPTEFGYRASWTNPNDSTSRRMGVLTQSFPVGNPGATAHRVPPNGYFTAMGEMYAAGAPTSVVIIAYFYKSDGTASVIDPTDSVTWTTGYVSGQRTRFTALFRQSPDAEWVRLEYRITSNFANGTPDVYWTKMGAMTLTSAVGSVNTVATGADDPGYFDGDTEGYMWQGNPHESASGDHIEFFTTVRRQQPFRESGGWVKDFQIPLVSEYAFIYGSALRSVPAATSIILNNRGNAPAFPLFRITGGNYVNPTITIGSTVFRTTGLTIASGETVEFDMLNHTGRFVAGARNGQSANRYIDFTTTGWPTIPAYDVSTTATVAGTGSGTLSALWRDTWV